MGRTWESYKLFNAMQSFSGTMPYQQLPPQLGWSQRRTPPRLRLVRGVAVVVVARRRAVRRAVVRRVLEEEDIVGLEVGLLAKAVGSQNNQ
jgi:hypothetical protein